MKIFLLLISLVSPLAFAEKIELNLKSSTLPTGISAQQYLLHQQDYAIKSGDKQRRAERAALRGEQEIKQNFRQQILVFLPTTSAETATVNAYIRLTEQGGIEKITLSTQDAEQAKIFQQAVHQAAPFQLPDEPRLKNLARNFHMQWPDQNKSDF